MVARSVKWSNSGMSRDNKKSGQQIVVHSSYQVNIIFVFYIFITCNSCCKHNKQNLQIFVYIA